MLFIHNYVLNLAKEVYLKYIKQGYSVSTFSYNFNLKLEQALQMCVCVCSCVWISLIVSVDILKYDILRKKY